ncbi:MAG: YicC family protein [Proteobacteria bacterium]|nr:YicC family protein [Pseudomonadota bacterium]MDE3208255.1 YicC family protein [Pseudomonadota bacterium]
MTGFATASCETPAGTLGIELRSVNHRFLEINFRLDETLRLLESQIRNKISACLRRGKVDCRITFHRTHEQNSTIRLNHPMVQSLLNLNQHLLNLDSSLLPLRIADILHWPNIMAEDKPVNQELIETTVLKILSDALNELQDCRRREGEKLKGILFHHLENMHSLIETARLLFPTIIKTWKEKTNLRLIEAIGAADSERIAQEMAIFMQRIDIEEEISRLDAHVSETRHLLETGGEQGKRLDFLMQELNREANTLGSKSVSTQLTALAMDLKVRIEQMREQIQNIE